VAARLQRTKPPQGRNRKKNHAMISVTHLGGKWGQVTI
jgi:hypothetical protein